MNKKIIWITGGSRGIGLALAKDLSQRGYEIVISGTAPAMQYISEGLFDYTWLDYKNVHYYPCNITDSSSVDFVLSNIIQNVGIPSALVNNAGIYKSELGSELDLGATKKMFDINTFGAMQLSSEIVKLLLKEKQKGLIANILSVAAIRHFPNAAVYGASKGALAAFAKSLREEVRRKGIGVLNIYPGATSTDIWPKEAREEFADRMMTAEDVAKASADAIDLSLQGSTLIEELVLRPVGGDLS
ncbi:MAG: SDR family oxidoreductase [Candidatus Kapaibacteriales bacterium]